MQTYQVIVWDPIKWSAEAAYVLTQNIPVGVRRAIRNGDAGILKTHFGAGYKKSLMLGASVASVKIGGTSVDTTGGASISMQDLDVKVKKAEVHTYSSKVVYPEDVIVYMEDKPAELKDKIYLATGIPTWRQHLFYESAESDGVETFYKLYVDGAHMQVNIADLAKAQAVVSGIPVSKQMYDQRAAIRVETHETFQRMDTIGALMRGGHIRVYVCDLGQFLRPSMQLDSYQIELAYYGCVLLYWPQISMEVFRDVLAGNPLSMKYPDLAPTMGALRTAHTAEQKIMNALPNDSRVVSVAITEAAITVANKRVLLNLRNIFDVLETAPDMPEIRYWADLDGVRYLLKKRHVQAQDITFPQNQWIRNGITCAIRVEKPGEQPRYMFFNVWPSGRYYARGLWKEDEEMTFGGLVPAFAGKVNALVRRINAMGHLAFALGSELTLLSPSTISYESLTACMYWKSVMLTDSFRVMLQAIDLYFRGRIFGVRTGATDKTEFVLRKGMFQFDPTLLDRIVTASGSTITNYYAYLSSAPIRAKWDLNYEGRPVTITHRTTDVRFEISNLREIEFITAYRIIAGLCLYVGALPEFAATFDTKDYRGVKKLKKLKEQDPELYDLRRYGSDRVYSILCQNQRQPLIHTEDELARMGVNKKKSLVKYWNFTLNKPAWYSCPQAQFPHMSFIVGVHPKGYCLPCCNKRPMDTPVTATCFATHSWDGSKPQSEHVIGYGKHVDTGRLARVQAVGLGQLFKHETMSLHVVGCAQNFVNISQCGIVHAIAMTLEVEVAEFVIACAKRVEKMPLNVLIGGLLVEYFTSSNDLAECMIETFASDAVAQPRVRLPYWPELFVELCLITYGCGIVIFVDKDATGKGIIMHCSEMVQAAIIAGSRLAIVLKLEQSYYPLWMLSAGEWFNLGIAQRVFERGVPPLGDEVIARIHTMIASRGDIPPSKNDLRGVVQWCNDNGWSCVLKYINMHNLVYGAICCDADGRCVHIPLDYSPNIADGIAETFEAPNGLYDARKIELATVLKFGTAWGAEFDALVVHDGIVIGLRTSQPTMIWCVGDIGTGSDLPKVELGFDVREVNAAIMRREPPETTLVEKIGPSLYSMYQYQLLLIEFVAYLDRERNEPFRRKLAAIGAKGYDRTLLQDPIVSIADRLLLQSQMNDVKNFPKLMSANVYDFDKITMRELQSQPIDQARTRLREIVSTFAVESRADVKSFPNIYLPCAESHAEYCLGPQLQVQGLDAMRDILLADLRNPLKSEYMLSNIWMDNNVNKMEFIRRPHEIITIYKLGEN